MKEWILCSERLPELVNSELHEDGVVEGLTYDYHSSDWCAALVRNESEITWYEYEYSVKTLKYYTCDDECGWEQIEFCDCLDFDKVVAWFPIQELLEEVNNGQVTT